MDTEQRIAQFEQMVKDDPMDDMAYFSLGTAYGQAGRDGDAATAFERCIAVNPNMSKAYQLAATHYIALEQHDKAKPLLDKGYEVSTLLGDMKPKNAIEDLYKQIGLEPPVIEQPVEEEIPEGAFVCAKSGRAGTEMTRAPFKGPVGEWIRTHISQETWREWIGQGTKVINELRLDLSRDEDSDTYDKYMHDYLGVPEDVTSQAAAN
ncbi:MAG: Fe(2+)-trafficking protein [Planctomycetota bacterium]